MTVTTRWTKQCADGRACSGVGSPAFVPDDVDICDYCLAAAYGLEENTCYGCNCCEPSETGYTQSTVLPLLRRLRMGEQPYPRYYIQRDHRWIGKSGKEVKPLTRGAQIEVWYAIYDALVPWDQREPIELFQGYEGHGEAKARADEMNATLKEEVV